jgi:hypothetical protein
MKPEGEKLSASTLKVKGTVVRIAQKELVSPGPDRPAFVMLSPSVSLELLHLRFDDDIFFLVCYR